MDVPRTRSPARPSALRSVPHIPSPRLRHLGGGVYWVAWHTPNKRQSKVITAVLALGEACLVHKLGDHHQAHPSQRRQTFELHVDANFTADTLVAIQPPIVNLDRQPLALAHTANFNMQTRRASVAMLDRIDTRLAK